MDLKNIDISKIKELLKDENVRRYIILGSAALFTFLYLGFAVIPAFFSLSKTLKEKRELKNQIIVVKDRIQKNEELSAQLDGLNEELKAYSVGLPKEKELSAFLEDLSLIAKISEVKILSITPSETKSQKQDEKEGEYYKEIPIVITAKSGYNQFVKFVDNLEKGKRFVTISGLRIKNDAASPEKHNVTIVLKTYVSEF